MTVSGAGALQGFSNLLNAYAASGPINMESMLMAIGLLAFIGVAGIFLLLYASKVK